MATFDEANFRAMFPEFSDAAVYPSAVLAGYWSMAGLFISSSECPYSTLSGDQRAAALNMLTAHLLMLGIQARTKSGLVSGKSGGFTTSASVGEVSVAKLAPPVSDGWQFWLSGTPYGQMLWALLSMLSVGGFAIGGLPEREGYRKVGGVFF